VKYGHELADGRYALSGGMAEFLVLRRGSAVVRVAAKLAPELICPVNCATATIAAALRAAGNISGRSVLIFGAGMLGVTASAIARSLGASDIVVCDISARRLDRVVAFGADRAVHWDPLQHEPQRVLIGPNAADGFDLILDLSGSHTAVAAAFQLAAVAACIVLVGSVMKSPLVPVDPEQIVRRCLSIYGVHNYAPTDLRTAVAFLERYGAKYPFAELVEFTYPLADVNEAVRRAIDAKPYRIGIRPRGHGP
jgi:alcohol dehydrogenase